MKEIVIISGKGGTGKTSIVAAFAAFAGKSVLADCDVDAADLHLVLHPQVRHQEDFVSGFEPHINEALCSQCGRCRELCRFGAIREDLTIDSFFCEGCGVCADNCPEKAISLKERICGKWFISDTRYGPMVHARLGIAEENSGKLVTLVRKKAKEEAESAGVSLILVDGSPGIGCPVIASIGGCDLTVIVSEPTVSGVHDAQRVLELTRHFQVPAALIINKCDLNRKLAGQLKDHCAEKGVPLLGEIPYDETFTHALIETKTLPEFTRGELTEKIGTIWESITARLQKGREAYS